MGHQSTSIYYKGGELKNIACQSTDNERGIIRIQEYYRALGGIKVFQQRNMKWKYSAMGNLLSAVTSLRLFLLKEKSMIYHLGGRDEEDLEGGGAGTHGFQEELRGNQSTPTYYKGRGLKKIACQSTDNERGIIRILQRLRRGHNQIHPTSSPSPPSPINNDQSISGLCVTYQLLQLHSIAGCRSLQLQESVQICTP